MTAIPGHLLDAARYADQTPARVRPELTRRVAQAILLCLPVEDPHTCLGRLVAAERNMRGITATQRKAGMR